MLSSSFVSSNVVVDNTGKIVELPVIITNDGILKSHLDYLLIYRHMSKSWISKSVHSIRLLLDYMEVNKDVFDKPKDMFREFSNSLFAGTLDENDCDSSGLFWSPREFRDAKSVINHITRYTDWLSGIKKNKNLSLNPFREATKFEEKLNWAAYSQRKNRAFLSHLWNDEDAKKNNKKVREVGGFGSPTESYSIFDSAKSFPEDKVDDLIHKGFILPGKEHKENIYERLNLRDILITMLMHYGGLRVSEVFHLFVEDVAIVPKVDLGFVVKVYDPEFGKGPSHPGQSRKEYLLKSFNRKVRTQYRKSEKVYAGWKSPMLTNSNGKFFTVFFFPQQAGEYFLRLWKLYLRYQRVNPSMGMDHPYAFTSRTGKPFTISSYCSSRQRAVERIGLVYGKDYRTTPHADRHSYGQRLAKSGIDSLTIKTAMHHRSIESQQVYTQPTEEAIRKQLGKADTSFALANYVVGEEC